MVIPLKFLILVVVVACLVVVVWIVIHEGGVPHNQEEVLTRMIELQKHGRYDKAGQGVQTWMNDSRRDISHDGLLYQQIAMVYIAKAYKKPKTKDESIRQSEFNLKEAQRLFEHQKTQDNDPSLFEIGGDYQLLADISDKDKCRLYEIARRTLEHQLPLIKGDSYTASGRTIPLEPIRTEIRKHLDTVNKKSSSSGCQAH